MTSPWSFIKKNLLSKRGLVRGNVQEILNKMGIEASMHLSGGGDSINYVFVQLCMSV